MAKIVILKNASDENIYPVTDIDVVRGGIKADEITGEAEVPQDISSDRLMTSAVTTTKIADGAVTAEKLANYAILKSGVWITANAISNVGGNQSAIIDISDLGFKSANDYEVILQNEGNASNGWASTTAYIKNQNNFVINLFNSHWSGGTIGSGNRVHWYILKK